MENEEEITPVVFRKWPQSEGGDILALFPTVEHCGYSVVSYQHIGGHGGADYGLCIHATRPAKPEEYASLQRELEGLGYRLKVYRKGRHLLHYRIRKETGHGKHV